MAIDPSNVNSNKQGKVDLYKFGIYDVEIDVRARYYRECEAMLAFYFSRGISVSAEHADEIGGLAGFLMLGIDKRADIPMASLDRMHRLLADAISPALPRTIELMHWDARNHRLLHRWVAPVPTIRSLVLFRLVSLGAVIASIYFGENSQVYKVSVLSLTGREFFHVITFYLGLAGLGSAFSVLYDARTYVVEGTYDPRIGSNYGIRIILGVVSGMILTQLIAQPELADVGATEGGGVSDIPYGMPILALLGGFASQFVYKGLNRMVEAMSSIFEPSRRDVLAAKVQEAKVAAQKSEMTATADRIAAAASVFSTLQKNPSAAGSPEVLEQLLQVAGSTSAGKKATSAIGTVLGPAQGILQKVEGLVQAGRIFASVVPDGELKSVLNKVARLESTVTGIKNLAETGSPFDASDMLVDLASTLSQRNPLHGVLRQTIGAFGRVPGVTALAGGPSGLAIALVLGTARLGGTAYDLWKVRVLDAEFNQTLIPPSPSHSAMAKTILEALPDLSGPLKAELMDNPAGRGDFAKRALAGQDAALFEAYGAAFGQGFDTFSALLRSFRQLAAGEELIGKLPPDVLTETGAGDERELFDALDEVRGNPQAFAALDQLFLTASNARDDESALEGLISTLRDMEKDESPE